MAELITTKDVSHTPLVYDQSFLSRISQTSGLPQKLSTTEYLMDAVTMAAML